MEDRSSNNNNIEEAEEQSYFTNSANSCSPPPPPAATAANDADALGPLLQAMTLEEDERATERDELIKKAAIHVQQAQAQAQRKYANQKIAEAVEDCQKKHEDRRYVFVADYSQNIELPFFGNSQPGDTYYFSHLKVNVFGVVDCCIPGGSLGAHVYHKGNGKKGGNNVASLLMKEFQEKGLLRKDKRGKELTILMDNCAGQNKNNMVLRLALYLVEAEFFEKVSFAFYIVGHTKNACDRWFNTLKKQYRRSNIYTYNALLSSLDTHENIRVSNYKTGDFRDYDSFLNKFYKKLEGGSVAVNHIFTAQHDNPTRLLVKRDNIEGTVVTTQELAKKLGGDNRKQLLRDYNIPVIPDPGIPEIKQVELYNKFRPLLPKEYQDMTCPHPGDAILNKIKNERNEKARYRASRKRKQKKNESPSPEKKQSLK